MLYLKSLSGSDHSMLSMLLFLPMAIPFAIGMAISGRLSKHILASARSIHTNPRLILLPPRAPSIVTVVVCIAAIGAGIIISIAFSIIHIIIVIRLVDAGHLRYVPSAVRISPIATIIVGAGMLLALRQVLVPEMLDARRIRREMMRRQHASR